MFFDTGMIIFVIPAMILPCMLRARCVALTGATAGFTAAAA